MTGEESEYDSCYYEVKVDPDMHEKYDPKELKVKITTKSAKLNAYIYAGSSRKLATKSLISGNEQVKVG